MKAYKLVLIMLVIGVVAYFGGAKFSKQIVYKQVEKEVILDNLTGKINEKKGELVKELRECESKGYVESDGLVTWDPNPKNKKVQIASFGLYQFKVSTVQFYYKKFYNKDVTGLEAIQIALSEEKSAELASEIIFRDGALNNWYNCTKAKGLQSKLDVINSLLK